MALFRRGKSTDEQASTDSPAVADTTAAEPKLHGPWDRDEVPGTEGRLDLGSLWLPGIEGMEIRLEIDQTNGQVVGVSVVVGESALQLQAFAAPRTLGIWDDIRDEIVESIRNTGGQAEVVEGPFGTQIAAALPQVGADGTAVMTPVVFVGVDGPRWFLRGFMSGPAVSDADLAGQLLGVFADTVVVRGTAAMAPRELLPLTLPEDAPEQPAAPTGPTSAGDLNPLERGPEITEVR